MHYLSFIPLRPPPSPASVWVFRPARSRTPPRGPSCGSVPAPRRPYRERSVRIFGQFARHRNPAFRPEHLGKLFETLHHAVGRLVEYHRARSSAASDCNCLARPFFWGRKPSKQNRSHGNPLCTSAGISAVARAGLDLDPRLDARPHEQETRDRKCRASRRPTPAPHCVRPRSTRRPSAPWRVR